VATPRGFEPLLQP